MRAIALTQIRAPLFEVTRHRVVQDLRREASGLLELGEEEAPASCKVSSSLNDPVSKKLSEL